MKFNTRFYALLCIGALLVASPMAYGHSGNLALAYPVEHIAIDGDLADWPEELIAYPIAHADYGDPPTGSRDIEAHFRIGYSLKENALYVAVEVADQSIVLAHPDSSSWDNQDGCELYVDFAHRPAGSRPTQYARNGDEDREYASTDSDYEVAVRRIGTRQVYEWRFAMTQPLHLGQSLGFDLSVADRDEDGSFSWLAWSPGTQKLIFSDRIGDVLLVDATTQFGQLNGRINWQMASTDPLPTRVRIKSLQMPYLWTQAEVDSTGAYRASLPLGPYLIQGTDTWESRIDPGTHIHAHVVAEQPTQADLLSVRTLAAPWPIGREGVLSSASALDTDEVNRFVQAYMAFYNIPGLSLALIKDEQVVYHRAFGVQDAASAEKVEDTTLFEVASMTKPVFAYTVARLVERGVLDWDVPLYKYLPYEDIAYDERYKLITARMVVSHTTGFPNWRAGKLAIAFMPGTEFGYSGEGFEYLSKVVSHLTGKAIADVVREEVFVPLGMDNAYLVWDESGRPKATAHLSGNTPVGKRQWDHPNMAASLHTDAETYARFLIAVSKGVGLSEAALEEMMTPQTKVPDADATHVGLGFFLEETAAGISFGHGGRNYGFTSNSAFYRESKIGYVLLVNNDDANKVDKELRAYLITGKTKIAAN